MTRRNIVEDLYNRALSYSSLVNLEQKGSTERQSQLRILSVSLVATCFGVWKSHHQANT